MKLALALCVAAVLVGCGSDSPTSPSGNQPFSQTVPGTVSVFGSTRHALSIPRSGNMTIRLTWGDGTVDLDLYLTQASCTQNLYPLSSCGIVLGSDAATGTSETITRSAVSGEQFQIWVDNLSTTQAMTYTLVITID